MMRLMPPGFNRFVQADSFAVNYGGAEANVAAALAFWGEESCFVSKVPSHELGQAAVNALRSLGVDTRFVLRGGDRLGVYYAERGVDARAAKVIYDRKGSAFSLSEAKEYDWENIFAGADWFHFTGITPALGNKVAELAKKAVKEAKNHGLTVSCDVNFRSKLWSAKNAKESLGQFFEYTDICIINENHAKELFGVSGESAMREMAEKFSFRHVAFTYRRTIDARHNKIWSELYSCGNTVRSREYGMEMTDRIGGGDAFAAGLIYALRHGFAEQKAVEFAEAASCLKHSVEGDICIVTVEEIEKLCGGVRYEIGR